MAAIPYFQLSHPRAEAPAVPVAPAVDQVAALQARMHQEGQALQGKVIVEVEILLFLQIMLAVAVAAQAQQAVMVLAATATHTPATAVKVCNPL